MRILPGGTLFNVAEAWPGRYGLTFDWLNVGGGIGVNYADAGSPSIGKFLRRIVNAYCKAPTLLSDCFRMRALPRGRLRLLRK